MSKQPKILYIDDEDDLLVLASSFFSEEKLPIDTCNDFSEAVNKIKNGTYDLIISDAKMPTGSGKDLLHKVREEKIFSGKSILVTGNLDYQDDPGSEGFDLVLFKPLSFEDLVNRVKRMLNF